MAKYSWGDAVKVRHGAAVELRPGSIAAIVGIHEGAGRSGDYFRKFPDAAVYTIEFEDGTSTEAPEADLSDVDC